MLFFMIGAESEDRPEDRSKHDDADGSKHDGDERFAALDALSRQESEDNLAAFEGLSKQGDKRSSAARRIILPILLVFILFTAAGAVYVYSMIKPPEIHGPEHKDAFYSGEYNPDDEQIGSRTGAPEGLVYANRKKDFYTFLIIGLDEGVNTDTIIVASFDAEKKEAHLISIPRDSHVNVNRSVKKINAAYPAGTLNGGGKQGGVDQLKREIKTIIGFVPDYYIVINLQAFVKIIDAVGGVEIDVPFYMKYHDPYQNLNIEINKGRQVLSGRQALQFARFRLADEGYRGVTDYERMGNQQAVIQSFFERLLRPANLAKLPDFIQIFSDNVFTDLKSGNMIWLAGQLGDLRGTEALSMHVMPTTGTSGLPMYYEYLDEPAIIELLNETINPYTVDIKAEDLDIISNM